MNKIKFLLASLLALLSINMYGDHPGYYIKNYSVDAVVHENSTITVTENIDVFFTMSSHGIYRVFRDWAWIMRDVSEKQDGSEWRNMHYKSSVDVLETSEYWEDVSESMDSIFMMRFGVFEKEYEGPHSYKIKYDYSFYGDRIPQADLFFYSVLGDGWDCEVKHFQFHIHFDKPLTDEELSKFKLYIGGLGSKENGRGEFVSLCTNTDIKGDLYEVPSRYAVSAYIPLREGYFIEGLQPRLYQGITWFFVALSVILILIVLYKEMMGDRSVTKTINFYPPKGCSSADVGILIDTVIDDRDLISLIPWFAEKGYLTIDNTGAHPLLHKIKDFPASAPKYQKTMFDGLFSHGDTFDLGNVPKDFGKVWLKTQEQAKSNFKDKLDDLDGTALFIHVCAILSVCLATCFSTVDNSGWILGGWLSVGYAALTFVQLLFTDKHSTTDYLVFGTIDFFILLIFGGTFIGFLADNSDPTYIPLNVIVGLLIFLLLPCFFAFQLTFMTPYRRERIGDIYGLEEFIRTADKPQLEQLQAEDEKYFYSVLPYAVAFGLADKWADKFKDIAVQPVDWYKGNTSTSISHGLANMSANNLMSKSLKNSVAHEKQLRAEREARAAARSSSSSGSSWSSSSSSGGGGYSGGGFGGGGGGRW